MCTGNKVCWLESSGIKLLIRMYKLSHEAGNHVVFALRRACVFWQILGSSSQLFVKVRHDLSRCISSESLFSPNTWLCLNSGVFTLFYLWRKYTQVVVHFVLVVCLGGSVSSEHKKSNVSFIHVNRNCSTTSDFGKNVHRSRQQTSATRWEAEYPVLTNSVEIEKVLTRSLGR